MIDRGNLLRGYVLNGGEISGRVLREEDMELVTVIGRADDPYSDIDSGASYVGSLYIIERSDGKKEIISGEFLFIIQQYK